MSDRFEDRAEPAGEATAGCDCGHGERCFNCATDEEMAAAIPPWPSMGGPDGH
jgi:hypothetical protein